MPAPRSGATAPAPHLPGLSGRSVRHLRYVRAVRSLRRILVSSVVGIALMVTAGIAVPAYAQASVEAQLPVPQTLSVVSSAAVATVDRDGYSVTAPPPLRWPLDSLKVASGFGPRAAPCSGCSTYHEGVDFDPGYGAKIHAIAAGVVVDTANPNYSTLGVYVVIRHTIDGKTVESVYGHMQVGSMPLKIGDKVKVGQVIGLVGSTGESTGPHLHFEILVNGAHVNPLPWMHARLG
ncbi:M23 family metallopeptidase [Terrimesophilobacter mesophilus]|nr:M23 family metallopeptidase [Terrimesophilobacter mesophilus]